MSFLHPYLGSPGRWIVYWIIMLQTFPENQGICITKDTFHCQNRIRSFIECKLQEGVAINSVTLVRPNPFLHCKYNIGKYSSERYVPKGYGYFGNVLWVTRSCRLRYKVCYSETTASKGASVIQQPITSTNVTSLSSTVVSNTDENSLKNVSEWYLNESHAEEAHKLKLNKTLIVVIVVSLAMTGVGLAVLGLYFWWKRPNRHRNSKKLSNKIENAYGLLAPGVKDNSYFILEPPKEYSPIQHNRLELQWSGSKEGNLQHEVTEGSSDKVVFDSNDTYCTINEVANAIQSLPDNEYNILYTKSKYFCPDSNYHSFQTMPMEKGYFSADDFAYTSTANAKVIHTVVDYSHIPLDRSLVSDERTFDNHYSHLSSL